MLYESGETRGKLSLSTTASVCCAPSGGCLGRSFAELIDVNPQTVGALERGDHYPSLDLAFRICDVFDLPVEAVFSPRAIRSLVRRALPKADTDARRRHRWKPSTTQTEPTLIDRYQDYRIRRFLKHERKYANALPGWRTQRRRRLWYSGYRSPLHSCSR